MRAGLLHSRVKILKWDMGKALSSPVRARKEKAEPPPPKPPKPPKPLSRTLSQLREMRRAKRDLFLDMRARGMTLKQIGDWYFLTKERVRQILLTK